MDTQTKKLNKPFNITSVCREDLTRFISKEKALKIDDSTMTYIAGKLADAFCDGDFWIALEDILENLNWYYKFIKQPMHHNKNNKHWFTCYQCKDKIPAMDFAKDGLCKHCRKHKQSFLYKLLS